VTKKNQSLKFWFDRFISQILIKKVKIERKSRAGFSFRLRHRRSGVRAASDSAMITHHPSLVRSPPVAVPPGVRLRLAPHAFPSTAAAPPPTLSVRLRPLRAAAGGASRVTTRIETPGSRVRCYSSFMFRFELPNARSLRRWVAMEAGASGRLPCWAPRCSASRGATSSHSVSFFFLFHAIPAYA
jgi:hypothetical protein